MSYEKLKGKRAIVTGGSKGLGRALVEHLSANGVQVVALARQSPELDAVNALPGCHGIACDLRDNDSIRDRIAEAAERMGGIDILVNNAGAANPVPFGSLDDDMIDNQVALNFTSTVTACRAAMPWLKEAQGHVVNVSSETVRHVSPFLGIYAATKAALERFTLELREEFRPDRVRVTILRSGTIATDIADNWPQDTMEEFGDRLVASGYRAFSGTSVPPSSMAEGIANILAMPEDLNLDIVEMRSGLPLPATGFQRVKL